MSFDPLLHPLNGGRNFGLIQALKLGGVSFPEAEIRLFLGKHIGPNRGFGAKHIWAEHRIEMQRAGLCDAEDVPSYVAQIIRDGTPLFFEGASFRNTRLLAVRAQNGTAILEFRDQRAAPIWSIVTAFSGTKTHGTRVGTVR